MTPGPTASTRLFALLGDPIHHSLSPALQNAAFRAAGVDAVYVALRAGPDDVAALMRGIARAGGGGNVTLPHKERAAAALDEASEAVRRTGACNTFWGDGGALRGDNTDVEGFRRALQGFLGRPPGGARVLLLGAGGAARAALGALVEDGAEEVVLLNRTPARARAVAERIGGPGVRVAEGPGEVEGGAFDLVVNATRLGVDPDDPLPLDLGRLERAEAVMDLVYGPAGTPLVRAASALGIPAADGAEMLVRQGAVAFERWWGTDAPVDAMRAAVGRGRPE